MCFSTALLNGNPVSAVSEDEVARAKTSLMMPKVATLMGSLMIPKVGHPNFAKVPPMHDIR